MKGAEFEPPEKLNVVTHVSNPSIWEAKISGSLKLTGQPSSLNSWVLDTMKDLVSTYKVERMKEKHLMLTSPLHMHAYTFVCPTCTQTHPHDFWRLKQSHEAGVIITGIWWLKNSDGILARPFLERPGLCFPWSLLRLIVTSCQFSKVAGTCAVNMFSAQVVSSRVYLGNLLPNPSLWIFWNGILALQIPNGVGS